MLCVCAILCRRVTGYAYFKDIARGRLSGGDSGGFLKLVSRADDPSRHVVIGVQIMGEPVVRTIYLECALGAQQEHCIVYVGRLTIARVHHFSSFKVVIGCTMRNMHNLLVLGRVPPTSCPYFQRLR